jgi:hypothetical protein
MNQSEHPIKCSTSQDDTYSWGMQKSHKMSSGGNMEDFGLPGMSYIWSQAYTPQIDLREPK